MRLGVYKEGMRQMWRRRTGVDLEGLHQGRTEAVAKPTEPVQEAPAAGWGVSYNPCEDQTAPCHPHEGPLPQAVLRLEFWILIGLAVVSVRVIVSMAPHIVLGPQFGNSTANND